MKKILLLTIISMMMVSISSLIVNAALTDQLFGYYTLDETSGTTAFDSSNYKANMTFSTGVTVNQAGKIGNSYVFASGSNLRSLPTSYGSGSGAAVLRQNITISAWAYRLGTGADPACIVSKKDNVSFTSVWTLGLSSASSDLYGRTNTAAGGYLDSYDNGIVLGTNEWVFLTYVYDTKGNMSIYVNGNLNFSVTGTGNNAGILLDSPNYFQIGGNTPTVNNWFNGRVDEVGIWNRTLNITEIQQLYNGGSGLTYPFTESTIVSEVNSTTPINNTYHYSKPTVTGTCSFSLSTANVTLYVNSTFCGANTSISTGTPFSITPTCNINFFTEQSWLLNCSGTDGVNSQISTTKYFYYANSTGCTGTGGTTLVYFGNGCYSALSEGYQVSCI